MLKQTLTVPDFWTTELVTSTVMLADGIDERVTPVSGDEVLERPYVIGTQEIHRSAETTFRRSVMNQPRAPLCGMGICFECRVTIHAHAHARSCQIVCRDGMDVRTDE